jgi:hypothetical protein
MNMKSRTLPQITALDTQLVNNSDRSVTDYITLISGLDTICILVHANAATCGGFKENLYYLPSKGKR